MQLYDSNTDDYGKDFELTPWEVDWIINGSKAPDDYDPFDRRSVVIGKLTDMRIGKGDNDVDRMIERIALSEQVIANVGKSNAECSMLDPFEPDDTQPEVEASYDPQWEQFITNEELRRGMA